MQPAADRKQKASDLRDYRTSFFILLANHWKHVSKHWGKKSSKRRRIITVSEFNLSVHECVSVDFWGIFFRKF